MSSGSGRSRRVSFARTGDRIPAEPARRIVIASLAIVVLLAGTLGVTIWRYESALDRYQIGALDARADAEQVKRAIAAFWQEQAGIFNYSLQKGKVVLARIESGRKDFADSLNRLHV